jgi:arylsulfatase A-like enzyme
MAEAHSQRPREVLVGFGASSAFGGLCRTPAAERLAEVGLKYTRVHTTA